MSDRQPLKATFFGFRKRAHSGVLLRASAGLFLLTLLLGAINTGLGMALSGGSYADFMRTSSGLSNGVTGVNAMLIVLMSFVIMFLNFVLLAAYEAACLRWMIRGETSGFLGLSFGADTWRVYGTYWLWLILVIACYVGLLIAGFATVAGASAGAPAVAWIWALIVPLFIAVPVYFGTRLAPAAATSVAMQRFAFFSAWKVTKGRFWALFGSFFVLWVVGIIVLCATFGTWLMLTMPNIGEMLSAEGGQGGAAFNEALIAAMTTPSTMVGYYAMALAMVVFFYALYILFYGVNARAVLAAADEGTITGVAGVGAAETFS